MAAVFLIVPVSYYKKSNFQWVNKPQGGCFKKKCWYMMTFLLSKEPAGDLEEIFKCFEDSCRSEEF